MNLSNKKVTYFDHRDVAVGTGYYLSSKNALVASCCLIAVLLSGCMTKRGNYDVPLIPLPAQYKNSPPRDSPTSTSTPKESAVKTTTPEVSHDVGMVDWWRSFGNSELVELIDRGLANNPDLRIATEQMAQAKTRVDQARAGMFPSLSMPLEFANQAPGGSIGIVTPGQSSGSQKTYQGSVQGNWRADLWGERSALAESAKFQLWQAAFNRDNVQRNMVASLSSSYVEYLSLNDRLRIARETEVIFNHMLEVLEKRVKIGDASLIELDQQKASIFAIRATIPILEQQREDAITTLAFLVGSVPGSLKLSDEGLDSLFLPSAIPALPSSLLLRRPDVRMAEARLLSADADVDVARARILPPLDLSAQVGHSSLAMAQFFQPSTLFWNAISSLTVSIFDGGKLKSDKENAQAVHEEMVETYARTIYQAVKEVESALAAIRLTGNRLVSQQEATLSARRVWDSSAQVYALGGLDYQSLLDVERNYQNYQNDYLQIKMASFHGYINLFQALGGGVNFVGQLHGKGVRPIQVQGDALGSVSLVASKISLTVKKSDIATDGIDWVGDSTTDSGSSLQVEKFWQVELPGLYHHSTIGATWRDLRTRYPKLMESRVVRPRRDGKIEDSKDDELSLFRLYVSKFPTPEAAFELCAALKANYQRCKVVSSRSDEEVVESPLTQKGKAETAASIDSGTGTSSWKESSPVTIPPEAEVHSAGSSEKYDKAEEKLAYSVQLGAFSILKNAIASNKFWSSRKYDVHVSEIKNNDGETRYVVRTGIFNNKHDASALAFLFRRKERASVVVVQTIVDKSGNSELIDMSDDLPHSHQVKPAVENVNHLSEVMIDNSLHRPARVNHDG